MQSLPGPLDRGSQLQLLDEKQHPHGHPHLQPLLDEQPPRCPTWRKRSQRCWSWACPACCMARAQEEAELIADGLRWAFSHRLDAFFWTFTDGSPHPLGQSDFNARCKRLYFNLGRAGLRWSTYRATLDIDTASGRLHRHVVALGGTVPGPDALAEHAHRAGLGAQIDCRQITPVRRSASDVGSYFARNVLHFALVHQLIHPGARIAPITGTHLRSTAR